MQNGPVLVNNVFDLMRYSAEKYLSRWGWTRAFLEKGSPFSRFSFDKCMIEGISTVTSMFKSLEHVDSLLIKIILLVTNSPQVQKLLFSTTENHEQIISVSAVPYYLVQKGIGMTVNVSLFP